MQAAQSSVGEGLVILKHVAANGRLPLDQIGLVARACYIQGGLHAGNTAADHQGVRIDRESARIERTLIRNSHQTSPHDDDRFCGSLILSLSDPGSVLANADHMEGPVRVQPRPLASIPEGFFMHAGRTGGNDNTGEVAISDLLFDEVLSRIRTHEQIIFGNCHAREGGRIFRHFLYSDLGSDVDSAVADEKSNSLRHESPPEKSAYCCFRFYPV